MHLEYSRKLQPLLSTGRLRHNQPGCVACVLSPDTSLLTSGTSIALPTQ